MRSMLLLLIVTAAPSCTVEPSSSSSSPSPIDLAVIAPPDAGPPRRADAGLDAGADTCPRITRVRKLAPFAGLSIGAGKWQTNPPVWSAFAEGDLYELSLPVESGERIDAVSPAVVLTTGWSLHLDVLASDGNTFANVTLAAMDAAAPTANGNQVIQIPLAEQVGAGQRVYWLQVVAHQQSTGFHPRVSGVSVTTSVPDPSCAL